LLTIITGNKFVFKKADYSKKNKKKKWKLTLLSVNFLLELTEKLVISYNKR
jgi:hypothetical protein